MTSGRFVFDSNVLVSAVLVVDSSPGRAFRQLAVSDRPAFRRSLRKILEWDFERVIPGHGDVVEHGGRAALQAAWLG